MYTSNVYTHIHLKLNPYVTNSWMCEYVSSILMYVYTSNVHTHICPELYTYVWMCAYVSSTLMRKSLVFYTSTHITCVSL